MSDKHFKIVNLHAENIKKLIAIDITPDGNMVMLAGKNGQGKTSILDSIFWACAGGDVIQGQPIREGQESGVIRIDIGDLVVERTFTEKNSYLKIVTKDGAKYGSPQKMLDQMMGSISFDPLAFTYMDRAKQYQTIRGIVPLEVDIDALEKKNDVDYERRTEIGRKVKALEGEVAVIEPTVPDDVPDEKIVVADLLEKIEDARVIYREHDRLAGEKTRLEVATEQAQKAIEEARRHLEAAENNVVQIKTKRDEATAAFKASADKLNEEKIDIAALQQKIKDAETVNKTIDQAALLISKRADLSVAERERDALTEGIERRKQEAIAAIAAAKMPIEGLGLQEGTVTYKGIPFDQASKAEQIRVSTAIAMAMNPKLRVIRIADGGLLDDDSLADIKRMAEEKDFQVWIELIKSDDPMAIVIEEGRIKGQNIEPTHKVKVEKEDEDTGEAKPKRKKSAAVDVTDIDAQLDAKKAAKAQGSLI